MPTPWECSSVVEHVDRDRHDVVDVLHRAVGRDTVEEAASGAVLHRHEQRAVELTNSVCLNDAGMHEPSEALDLAAEPRRPGAVADQLREHDLDGDRHSLGGNRQVDHAHATTSELALIVRPSSSGASTRALTRSDIGLLSSESLPHDTHTGASMITEYSVVARSTGNGEGREVRDRFLTGQVSREVVMSIESDHDAEQRILELASDGQSPRSPIAAALSLTDAELDRKLRILHDRGLLAEPDTIDTDRVALRATITLAADRLTTDPTC